MESTVETIELEDSILNTTKSLLGIQKEYTHFDQEIILSINSALMVLSQLGLGPEGGYRIKDKDNKWIEFIDERIDLESVKTSVFLRVKLMFDPPATSYLQTLIHKQMEELEWRLMTQVEQEDRNNE